MSTVEQVVEAAIQRMANPPREWWLVVRQGANPDCYPTQAHAEAVRTANEFNFPLIGPWTVVHVREQQS